MNQVKHSFYKILLVIMISGCATNGNFVIQGGDKGSIDGVSTVSFKCDPQLSYWWHGSDDLKEIIVHRLSERLTRAGIRKVEENPDLTIVIKEIQTGGWTACILIAKIVVVGLQDDKEVLRIEYTQPTESFTLRAFIRPARENDEVADLLSNKIIKAIKRQQR